MFQVSQAKLCVHGVETAGTKAKVYNRKKKNYILHIAYVLIRVCAGASNEVNGEKQAVVQRSVTVLSQRLG